MGYFHDLLAVDMKGIIKTQKKQRVVLDNGWKNIFYHWQICYNNTSLP